MRNTHKDFVGINVLIKKQEEQLQEFKKWSEDRQWNRFHESHYDWWMFPIDRPSRLGYRFVVYDHEISALKSNADFMQNYLEGVRLLLLSWGWDLEKSSQLEQTDPDQTWHNWPIRLYKCAQSLKLFGSENELKSVVRYGKLLIEKGMDFTFRGKDLKPLFQ